MKEQFIARDTREPLKVLDGYDVLHDGSIDRAYIDTARADDYGADPLGDGTFRMVPSGDIVDYQERCKRLSHKGTR